jgi:hypothetical protein
MICICMSSEPDSAKSGSSDRRSEDNAFTSGRLAQAVMLTTRIPEILGSNFGLRNLQANSVTMP